MARSSFAKGVSDIAPALPANVSVGLLFGASAVPVGLSAETATVFSLLAMAARSQLAAIGLLQEGAGLAVVMATVLLINVRYVTFSAALAPKVVHLSWRWRALLAYPLIDVTYTLADTRFADDEGTLHRGWYFAGLGLPWTVGFVGATLAGALLGRVVGPGFRLEFMIPLIFIALLVSQIDSRPGLYAAAAAAGVAMLGGGLPFNLGLLAAGVVGAAVGERAARGGG